MSCSFFLNNLYNTLIDRAQLENFKRDCKRRAQYFGLNGTLKTIFFPFNIRNRHWALYWLEITYQYHSAKASVYYYDSLDTSDAQASKILDIFKYLWEEMPTTREVTTREVLWRLNKQKWLTQDDGCNCGYYVLKMINMKALDIPMTESFDPALFRQEVGDVLEYKIQRAMGDITDAARHRMQEIVETYRRDRQK